MMRLTLIAATALAAVPALAQAEPLPRTRLVECGVESCLQVSGRRASIDAPISINGHEVPTTGRRFWKARIPVSEVRRWAAPFDRNVTVSVENEEHIARLPVGMLGTRGDLAMLVVSVK
ncbi:hypothetical protein C7451_104223 [Blastomonas natatoria]|uniref:Uncharacterized protein n=1 Tax=Blastomonas natatoria TaxID=34015 RepID=A0A2V3V7S3_9SPHN|nr:hypothetical protein [Blastomonas natatoria]PXW77727.1 hypothetical protein C7451_104223 [Blastomonas natatoria]